MRASTIWQRGESLQAISGQVAAIILEPILMNVGCAFLNRISGRTAEDLRCERALLILTK